MSHAILSPSSAHRWMMCTPSARLEAQFPDQTSAAAAEGTLAHAVAEAYLRVEAGLSTPQEYQEAISSCRTQNLWQDEMLDYACGYAMSVVNRLATARETTPDAELHTEVRLDMTDYVPEGFGTGDAVIIADGNMEIIDYKYGKGVQVDAYRNPQMMLYALGAIKVFGFLYDIKEVTMSIYQPRISNYPSFYMTVEELTDWAEQTLKPAAALAWDGKGTLAPGEHCRFCRAAGQCSALYRQAVEAAVSDSELLSPAQLGEALSKADAVEIWLKRVRERALELALSAPGSVTGWKVVEGRSLRTIKDQDACVAALKAEYDEAIFMNRSLMNLTDLTKALGKKDFERLVGPYIVKPQGKPTLAPEDDKREVFNPNGSAHEDFAQ